ncbi:16S rRNA (cytosine(967)-C(5))-methyltransferase RsmB [Paenibacillus flagellatus]|uniref:16S rRNA (cytosine(967)-C(5))-methyltransferase n=1 Tax=Paenibacillus flagellatus TaxID=2211139 RepID=A0A2V5K533_9BACL|nr:16S rRNA (cytosine(967)-C(5))-methyltransferase RsmB [Paenibacillus flagellatus]PYI54348.1 16S rRNA (cytosine(967)-C(5))-methyltransferase RsmB [Paenibacillus flagellatus]
MKPTDNRTSKPAGKPKPKPNFAQSQPAGRKGQAPAGTGKPRPGAAKSAPAGKDNRRPPTARELALDVLTRVETEGAYSNLLLNQALQRSRPDKPDAALATELVYGTIQRRNTIDYFLDRFVAKGVAKLEPWVRNLLRLSFYQLHNLDRIPEHAAVNEAVNIAKRKGHAGISGMVNGVLRNVIRRKSELTVPAGLPAVSRIALEHSHPEWLVADWIRRFGEETAESVCRSNNEPPHTSVRVNALKLSRDELLERLASAGCEARPSALSGAGVIVAGGGNMALTPWYAGGELSVQDESSMLVAEMVDARPGMSVLDCCAAPGGKTAHMAERMNDTGRIVACDIHEHKRALIEEQAKRLGLRSVETRTIDARKLAETFGGGAAFDRILLDAPCSGLGVIRRKPDIKWAKRPEDVAEIAALQRELLAGVAGLLAPGGVLVYSTCTIAEEENERVVESFLRDHPAFEPDMPPVELLDRLPKDVVGASGAVTILPHRFGSDGFFIARLRRKSERH